MKPDENSRPIDPQVRIGHVHLKVADLERSLQFYCGVPEFAFDSGNSSTPVAQRCPAGILVTPRTEIGGRPLSLLSVSLRTGYSR